MPSYQWMCFYWAFYRWYFHHIEVMFTATYHITRVLKERAKYEMTPKWPFKRFWPPHINQIRCVLKNKNVVIKVYYIMLILRLILCTLLMFLLFHVAWIIASARLGYDKYKFFTIFTGTKYHTLWLGSKTQDGLFSSDEFWSFVPTKFDLWFMLGL